MIHFTVLNTRWVDTQTVNTTIELCTRHYVMHDILDYIVTNAVDYYTKRKFDPNRKWVYTLYPYVHDMVMELKWHATRQTCSLSYAG